MTHTLLPLGALPKAGHSVQGEQLMGNKGQHADQLPRVTNQHSCWSDWHSVHHLRRCTPNKQSTLLVLGSALPSLSVLPTCLPARWLREAWSPVGTCIWATVYLSFLVALQVLALAAAFQSVTKHHLMQPPIDKVESDVVDKALKLKYSRAWLAEQVQTFTVTPPSTPPRASQ